MMWLILNQVGVKLHVEIGNHNEKTQSSRFLTCLNSNQPAQLPRLIRGGHYHHHHQQQQQQQQHLVHTV